MARDIKHTNISTSKQIWRIWKFACDWGSRGHNNKEWADKARAGLFTKRDASKVIGLIIPWMQNDNDARSIESKEKIETWYKRFYPDFTVMEDPPKEEGKKKNKIEERKGGSGKGSIPDTDSNIDEDNEDTGSTGILELDDLKKEFEEEESEPLPEPENVDPLKSEWKHSEDYIPSNEFPEACFWASAGENILLTGPKGCGKSRMGKEIQIALDLDEVFTISFGGSMRYPQVFGGSQIKVDKKGKQYSEWVPSPLLEAIQKRSVVVIDEIFSVESDVNNGLNSLLENGDRSIMTPIGKIERHPENVIIATANTNGRELDTKYMGANIADTALLDRFIEIKVDYDSKVEEFFLNNMEDQDAAGYLRDNLLRLRDKIRLNNIQFDPSTRRLLGAIKGIENGLDKTIAFEANFLRPLSKAERRKIGYP